VKSGNGSVDIGFVSAAAAPTPEIGATLTLFLKGFGMLFMLRRVGREKPEADGQARHEMQNGPSLRPYSASFTASRLFLGGRRPFAAMRKS
jgi:hypothetical protein